MPGVGVRTAARLLTEISGKEFATAGHLAAYADFALVTRRSGSSIRGEHPSRRGNKILKRALFLSAFAALRDPASRAYYDRKIAQGKRQDQALIALAQTTPRRPLRRAPPTKRESLLQPPPPNKGHRDARPT